MSLMLRKKCQIILDSYNLQNYHVTISEETKCLKIVTECGKPMANIEGITFSRICPTKDEIVYASELLQDFLTTHKVQFGLYVQARTTFINKKVIEMESKDGKVYFHTNYGSPDDMYLSYMDGPFKFHLDDAGNIAKIEINDEKKAKPAVLTAYKYNSAKGAKAYKHLDAYRQYKKEQGIVDAMLVELSSCDI